MLIRLIRVLAHDRKGGTAIEYGLIAALIVIAAIPALITLAGVTTGMWSNVNTKIGIATGN